MCFGGGGGGGASSVDDGTVEEARKEWYMAGFIASALLECMAAAILLSMVLTGGTGGVNP